MSSFPTLSPVVTLQPCPHLVLRTASGSRYLPLAGGNCWTIGRSADNDFVLSDPWISRNHAMLQCMDDHSFYLIDLGSRNGSFVNGRRVSIPVTLNSGDRITLGQTELDFYSPAPLGHVVSDEDRDFAVTAALHVRRLISVLVVDIRNFTGLTRKMDEKVLSELIGNWFRQAGQIISEHGSWVDKYIGDAVMAVWIHGEEEVSPKAILRIFRAIEALRQMTHQLQQDYPLPFPLRIGAGVNTGYAMVGNTGSNERPDYTALGDTVNAAFRLESSTKELQLDVAVGRTTYQYLCAVSEQAQDILHEHLVTMKGYDDPALAYAGTYEALAQFLADCHLASSSNDSS